jgi:ribonucleoside-diphosphate reductase alpha chain
VRQPVGPRRQNDYGLGRHWGNLASEQVEVIFHDKLPHLLLNQTMAFNSPVWFNCGVEVKPLCSACFINAVENTMGSILDLAKTEGMLFKWGSSTGSNLSPIRSSKEQLSDGGTPSGPVSFMKGFDAFARRDQIGRQDPARREDGHSECSEMSNIETPNVHESY